MKRAYSILFLCLTTIFSFGFTTSEHSCKSEKCATHSCCEKPVEDLPANKCDGTCCFNATTVSIIEEGLVSAEKKQTKRVVSEKLVAHVFSVFLAKTSNETTALRFGFNPYPYLKIPDFIPIKTQSWLI